jgi:uncharacterized delta-60 repeat protein
MTSVGWTSRAWDIVADGNETVVAGETAPFSGGADFCVIRYDQWGNPKSSFAGDGIATVDFGKDDHAHAVAVLSDGRVVVAGSVGGDAIGVARFNADGSLDKTFGLSQSGKRVVTVGALPSVRGIAVAADGKIVIAARANADFLAVRLTSVGAVDMSLSSDGKAMFDFTKNDDPRALLVDGSAEVVLAGSVTPNGSSSSKLALLRLESNGAADLGFGVGGLASHPPAPLSGERLYAIKPEADGYLVAGVRGIDNGVRMLSAKIAR